MKHILILISMVLIRTVAAQNLPDYIPADAQYVFGMNLQQLSAKSNQMDYTRYLSPLIKESTGYYNGNNSCELISIKDIIQSPGEYGIGENLFVYSIKSDEMSGTVFLFSLADAKKFEAKLNTACQDAKQMVVRSTTNGKVYAGKTSALSFNKQMATLFIKAYNYYDYYDTDYDYAAPTEPAVEYEDAPVEVSPADTTMAVEAPPMIEEVIEMPAPTYVEDSALIRDREERAMRKLETTADQMEKYLLPAKENYTSNREFYQLLEGHHDAFFFFNSLDMVYDRLYFPFGRGMYGSGRKFDNKNRFLMSGMNSTYTLDFENGRAVMNMHSNYNKNAYSYFEKAYDIKQSKKLFKYIDAKNLLGYASFAVNSEALAGFYGEFYKELFDSYTDKSSRKSAEYYNMLQAAKLLYAILDKEMLYNTFRSQAIFACTGFEEMKVTYTTYDYDENFKRQEKTVEKTEKIPRLVLLSAIGNKEKAKKLFDIISGFSVFKKISERVFVFTGYQKMPLNVYFALTDDALIITTDADLAMNRPKGYGSDRQMDKAEKKVIMQHNTCMKIYGSKLMAGLTENYFKDGETVPRFMKMMTNLGDMEMYDSKPTETSYGMTAVMNLKDNSSNALYQLLRMMSSINEH